MKAKEVYTVRRRNAKVEVRDCTFGAGTVFSFSRSLHGHS